MKAMNKGIDIFELLDSGLPMPALPRRRHHEQEEALFNTDGWQREFLLRRDREARDSLRLRSWSWADED